MLEPSCGIFRSAIGKCTNKGGWRRATEQANRSDFTNRLLPRGVAVLRAYCIFSSSLRPLAGITSRQQPLRVSDAGLNQRRELLTRRPERAKNSAGRIRKVSLSRWKSCPGKLLSCASSALHRPTTVHLLVLSSLEKYRSRAGANWKRILRRLSRRG